ncbi:MAG: suppressor of fused domain protein [Crocinitomicaceae bacterium]|nr:suppressor of fused domain protein [Crocinitomicaceae bacterium]
MHVLQQKLIERFGENVQLIQNRWGEFLLFQPKQLPTAKVLMTIGLSDFKMNVHEKHVDEEFNELYFLLPSYWDSEAIENPKFNWVFSWLQRLKNYTIEKNTWLGHGHTMPCGKDMESLSESMLQNHFIISNPIELYEDLQPVQVDEKMIRFLAVIPIFPDEMDYKQGKGTMKLFKKLISDNVTEKLDDYRNTVLKSRWNFFGR